MNLLIAIIAYIAMINRVVKIIVHLLWRCVRFIVGLMLILMLFNLITFLIWG
jgi:energy-coupling factor transporter transmembrane protein EcfT